MTLSCVAIGCAIPRRHVPGCDDEECRGCLPALADVGRLCERHLNRIRSTLVGIGDLAVRLPEVLVPGTGKAQRVTGTPERSAPLNLDAFDLDAPVRLGAVHDDWHDQYGQISVATVLELWVRDWRDTGNHGALPAPMPEAQLGWLSARMEWAAKHHPAIVDFITAMERLHSTLRGILGENDPLPERCRGVPCRRCDERNLYRRADGSGDVDCHTCGTIYRRAEYDDWLRLLAAPAHREWLEEKARVVPS